MTPFSRSSASLLALCLGSSVLVAACNSSEKSPGPDPVGSIPDTTLTTEADAGKATASVLGDMVLTNAINQGDFSTAMGDFMAAGKLKAPAVPEFSLPGDAGESLAMASRHLRPLARQFKTVSAKLDGTITPQATVVDACDVGTMTTVDTATGATVTYDNCTWLLGGASEVYNGTIKFVITSYTATSFTVVMTAGDGDNAIEASDMTTVFDDGLGGVTTSISSVKSKVIYKSTAGGMGMDISYTTNGVVSEDDGVEKKTFRYSNYRVDFAFQENLTDMDVYLDGSLDVDIDLAATGAGVDSTSFVGFNNYVFTYIQDALDATIDYTTQDGKIVYTNDPVECEDGSYTVTTVVPFKRESGVLTAGMMTINDTVTIEVIAADTVRVTIGGLSTDYTEGEIFNICLI